MNPLATFAVSPLAQWRTVFRDDENTCPWPGPRPLSAEAGDDMSRFVGRIDETREFLQLVDEHSLVIFHGKTGTGKSSLLNMGLTTVLGQTGYTPLICGRWDSIEQREPEDYIAAALESQGILPEEVRQLLADKVTLTRALDEVYDGQAVLILDQFEELIRHQRQSFLRLVEWLLSVNRSRRTKIVLSLRSEYVYELADLMRDARPFSTAYLEIQSIADEQDIRAIISGPEGDDGVAIDAKAVECLLKEWNTLKTGSKERSLLYLQAVLFALYWHANPAAASARDGITAATVTSSDLKALQDHAEDLKTDLFGAGFDQTIEVKLTKAAEACWPFSTTVRESLKTSVREQIRRSVAHLSSGEYKLERKIWDLFQLSCERELEMLCSDPDSPGDPGGRLTLEDAKRLVYAALRETTGADVLSITRPDLMARAEISIPKPPHSTVDDATLGGFGIHPVPWRTDPQDRTAGALLGFGPWEALVEQVRAFAFALEWLKQASVIRVSAVGSERIATLIHDGFGVALENWSRRHPAPPYAAIASLTAYEGEQWDWRGHAHREFDGGAGWKMLVNLRWRRCEIAVEFRKVVFVNCDFRATRFVQCRFEGVTFVNCLLDGASLEDCTVIGYSPKHDTKEPGYIEAARAEQALHPEASADRLPEFVIPVSDTLVSDFDFYRGTNVGGTDLYSPTSGVAAVPWKRDDVPGSVDWEPSPGGLTMLGGRLSSLMIRACNFDVGSATFAHIAGSSLDIVEQDSAEVTLSWSTVLGLSVSNCVDAQRPAVDPKTVDSEPVDSEPVDSGSADNGPEIKVTATECVLANTWFGPELAGTVSLRHCVVFSLTNVSDLEHLNVIVANSQYGQVFNARCEPDCKPLATGTGEENGTKTQVLAPTIRVLAEASRRMAYRSTPAQVELERRAHGVLKEHSDSN